MIFNYDKSSGKWSSIFTKMGKDAGQNVQKGILDGALKGFSELTKEQGAMTVGEFMDSKAFAEADAGLQSYLNDIPEIQRNTINMAEAFDKA